MAAGDRSRDLSSHSRALLSKEVLSGQPPASSHAQRADETGSTGNPEWRRPLWAAGDPGAPVEMTAAHFTRQRRKGRCEDGQVAQPVVPSRPSPILSSALFSYPTAEDSWQNPLLPTAKWAQKKAESSSLRSARDLRSSFLPLCIILISVT